VREGALAQQDATCGAHLVRTLETTWLVTWD
jgi:hypothetical protein